MSLSVTAKVECTNLPVVVDGNAFITTDSGKFVSEHSTLNAAKQSARLRTYKKWNLRLRVYALKEDKSRNITCWLLKYVYVNGRILRGSYV